MSEQATKILKGIRDALDKICANLNDKNLSDKVWTQNIFESIAEAVLPSGVSCCCSCFNDCSRHNCYGEWLYDMTWYTEDDKHRLEKIILVLESEWSPNEYKMKYDFEKLLQAKCETKVFICQSEKGKDIAANGIKAYAKENEKYNNNDEKYLIAIYNGAKFKYFDGEGMEI